MLLLCRALQEEEASGAVHAKKCLLKSEVLPQAPSLVGTKRGRPVARALLALHCFLLHFLPFLLPGRSLSTRSRA
ncbi:hypothetical protein Naga_103279g1 [Nannochloropsis gaditana]|uniref:Uncharacterized protein n=1 Tax=Nannochloropsis gaditana TaxID=72520 RepID=W7U3H7_9STRA|nr:hypothetical protein Naga_103279g1 [Nannochloropsis gaditana]